MANIILWSKIKPFSSLIISSPPHRKVTKLTLPIPTGFPAQYLHLNKDVTCSILMWVMFEGNKNLPKLLDRNPYPWFFGNHGVCMCLVHCSLSGRFVKSKSAWTSMFSKLWINGSVALGKVRCARIGRFFQGASFIATISLDWEREASWQWASNYFTMQLNKSEWISSKIALKGADGFVRET